MKLQGVKVGDVLTVIHGPRRYPTICSTERYVVTELTPSGKAVRARRVSIESEHKELSFNVSTGRCVMYYGICAELEKA